jgi:hypothetical protein
LGSKYYQNEERSKTNSLVCGRKRENQWYQSYQRSNVLHFFLISLIILSDLSTIQFRLAFKDKGHKSLEYCCLLIHLTSVISTISNAESNGGIVIQRRIFIFSFGGWINIWGAAACFGRGVVATPRKAKEKV